MLDEYMLTLRLRALVHDILINGICDLIRHRQFNTVRSFRLYKADCRSFPHNVIEGEINDIAPSNSHIKTQLKNGFVSQRQRAVI